MEEFEGLGIYDKGKGKIEIKVKGWCKGNEEGIVKKTNH